MRITTLATRRLGEQGDDSVHPLLSDAPGSGVISLDRYDGVNVEYLVATEVVVSEIGGQGLRPVQQYGRVKFDVCITDGRVALACKKWDRGPKTGGNLLNPIYLVLWPIGKAVTLRRMKGKALVGQIRYPWIGAVGASSRARGNVDAIRIRYAEKYPDMELHKMLELRFPKGTDATLIAQDIIRRVAAYRLAHYPDLKDAERDAFARLRQDPPRPAPEPGKFAFTALPDYYGVNGATAFPDSPPST